MKDNDYQLIKKELREYVNKIRVNTNYFRSDFIAEWALLTTIACWGAPEGIVRFISFMITLIFFSSKIYIPQRKRTTPHFIFMMKSRIINAHLLDEQRIFVNKRLIKVHKITKNTNLVFYIRRCWKYILGYSFLVFSSMCSIFLDLNFQW
ncbi:TPA: hypothetical protein ACUPQ2_004871 [Escherichia coli]